MSTYQPAHGQLRSMKYLYSIDVSMQMNAHYHSVCKFYIISMILSFDKDKIIRTKDEIHTYKTDYEN